MAFWILNKLLSIPAILIAFSFREYARAKVADKLGDKSPRFQGRLTLDPFAHIDPIGFIVIVLCGFGWSKPVEVNRNAFKTPKKDSLKVNLAAWLSNLIVAIIGAIVWALFSKFAGNFGSISVIIGLILQYIVAINVNLFVFNILPLPGLDGFRILEDFSPKHFYKIADAVYQHYMLILLLVVLAGGRIIQLPSEFIIKLISKFVQIFI